MPPAAERKTPAVRQSPAFSLVPHPFEAVGDTARLLWPVALANPPPSLKTSSRRNHDSPVIASYFFNTIDPNPTLPDFNCRIAKGLFVPDVGGLGRSRFLGRMRWNSRASRCAVENATFKLSIMSKNESESGPWIHLPTGSSFGVTNTNPHND
jgi:hypothetical protein